VKKLGLLKIERSPGPGVALHATFFYVKKYVTDYANNMANLFEVTWQMDKMSIYNTKKKIITFKICNFL
jgi:hypothetical protein